MSNKGVWADVYYNAFSLKQESSFIRLQAGVGLHAPGGRPGLLRHAREFYQHLRLPVIHAQRIQVVLGYQP